MGFHNSTIKIYRKFLWVSLLLLFLYFFALFVSGWEIFMNVGLDFYLLLYTTSSLSFFLGFGENTKTARFGFCETKPFGEEKRFVLHCKN